MYPENQIFNGLIEIANIALRNKPLLLAPMEDVSDPPFRVLCKELGADLVFTEFISSEGLIRDADKSLEKLDIWPGERPVGIQIFGDNIESMRAATRVAEQANPEIIDINYGCPVKAVACKGAGAGILKDIDKMEAMTREIVNSTRLPVTVKTRLGWDNNSIRIVEVALRLQDVGIKALTIHGRTRTQMYKGEADWSWIQKVKEHPDIEIPIFGNGDVDSPEKAKHYFDTYKVDGIMIGRASIGNPWIFNEIHHFMDTGTLLHPPSLAERVRVCIRHFEMELAWKEPYRAIVEMRRHYAKYFKGVANFKDTRMALVTSLNPNEIFDLLNKIPDLFVETEKV